MSQRFEYIVCQTQWGHVTFVNGDWQGTIDYQNADQDAAYKSCPKIWEYLNRAGEEGWELVGTVMATTTHSEGYSHATNQLFMKRAYS
jgi:hypothetical protein